MIGTGKVPDGALITPLSASLPYSAALLRGLAGAAPCSGLNIPRRAASEDVDEAEADPFSALLWPELKRRRLEGPASSSVGGGPGRVVGSSDAKTSAGRSPRLMRATILSGSFMNFSRLLRRMVCSSGCSWPPSHSRCSIARSDCVRRSAAAACSVLVESAMARLMSKGRAQGTR